jgi:hypothetical protein
MLDSLRVSRYLAVAFCVAFPLCVSAQTPAPDQPAPAPPPPLTIRLGNADFRLAVSSMPPRFTARPMWAADRPRPFGTIPFANTPQGNLSETRLTAQSSRVNLLVTTKMGSADVKGFLEIDFLGAGPGNAFVYANSHTPRMRHAWMQYARGKYAFTAGQTWTLLTPNRQGLSPVSADVIFSQNLDPNLQLGLVWARQNQFRFVGQLSKTIAAGVSIENPQPFIGSAVVLPDSFPASEVDSRFDARRTESVSRHHWQGCVGSADRQDASASGSGVRCARLPHLQPGHGRHVLNDG